MLKIVNKTTKKLRIALIEFFLIILFANSLPFIQGSNANNELQYFTPGEMLLLRTSYTDDAAMTESVKALQTAGASYLTFFIIPIIGFLFAAFDRERNLKNIAGILCSIAGVMAIIYLVGAYISIGALAVLFLYLVTFMLSIYGMFARYLKVSDKQEKTENK